jgi:hypothetical protein
MKPLFVALTKASWESCLSKSVDPSRLNGTFQSMIEYMVDSRSDELNKEYTPADPRLAQIILDNLKQELRERNGLFEVSYISTENNLPKRVKLDDKLSNYQDIRHTKENLLEGAIPYDEIQLVCERGEIGGCGKF